MQEKNREVSLQNVLLLHSFTKEEELKREKQLFNE